ncbi:MAG: hypothetical protein IKN33_06235 [Selenomonadaceae bacterium]|nr:hypothetical protein [Selenomonadaceae bacterium]
MANTYFKIRHNPRKSLFPTAFRQRGRYVILPDVRLICQRKVQKILVHKLLPMRYNEEENFHKREEGGLHDFPDEN